MNIASKAGLPPLSQVVEFVGGLREATPAEKKLFEVSSDFKMQVSQACIAIAMISTEDRFRESYMTRCVDSIRQISDPDKRRYAEHTIERLIRGTPVEILYRKGQQLAVTKPELQIVTVSESRHSPEKSRFFPTSIMIVVLLATIVILGRNPGENGLSRNQFARAEVLIASAERDNRSLESDMIRDLELYRIPNVNSDRQFGWSFHFFVPSKQEDQRTLDYSLKRHADSANGELPIGFSGQVDSTNGMEVFVIILSDRSAEFLSDPDCGWLTKMDREGIQSARSDAEFATVIHGALRRLGLNSGYDLQVRAVEHVDP